MYQEPDNSNDRLREAAAAVRDAVLPDHILAMGEEAILKRFSPRRAARFRGMYFAAGLAATAIGATIFLMPSRSYAAELNRIAQNGHVGTRHVKTLEVQPDGSLKLTAEFFADGGRARWIPNYTDQILWEDGRTRVLHTDGATEIYRWDGNSTGLWMNDSAQKVLAFNTGGSAAKVRAERNVSWHGLSVDRFTIDQDYSVLTGQNRHSHVVLTSDPSSQRPLEMVTDAAGSPRSITQWDYSPVDPKMLELPPSDPTRIFYVDDELASIHDALGEEGPHVTVAGQRVELLQLWIDESGHACAIAQANYPCPSNYGIHIVGRKSETTPEGDPFSGRYWAYQPSIQNGRPIQIFHDNLVAHASVTTVGDSVAVEVPVFKNKAFVGYARFKDVHVNRTWNVYSLLEPANIPFWDKSGMRATATQAVSESTSRP